MGCRAWDVGCGVTSVGCRVQRVRGFTTNPQRRSKSSVSIALIRRVPASSSTNPGGRRHDPSLRALRSSTHAGSLSGFSQVDQHFLS